MNRDDPDPAAATLKPVETWHMLPGDPELWHHRSGVIVNQAALDERAFFYTVIRVGVAAAAGREPLLAQPEA